jgi:hypothetical protein
MDQLPNTVVDCDGCEKELNLLHPHLVMPLKAVRKVLVVEEETTEDPNEIGEAVIYLGDKSGRGVILRMHGFDCMAEYAKARKGKMAKLEVHVEDEIYEPEDNRSPEELVKDGDLPKAMLAVHTAAAKDAEDGDN